MAKKRFIDFPELERDLVDADVFMIWGDAEAQNFRLPKSKLPAGVGTGGDTGGTTSPIVASPSPFMVFNNGVNYHYDEPTNTIIISDERLLNKTLYPVSCTQFGGGELRTDILTYDLVDPNDDTKGKLVISGFALADGEHITINVPGEITSSSNSIYTNLLADVALLKQIAAPFMTTVLGANGGKIWWPVAAGNIPAGWQECTAMRGFVPVAQDPADVYDAITNPDAFGRGVGITGGRKGFTLTENNIPQIKGTIPGSESGLPHTSGEGAIGFGLQKNVDVPVVDFGKEEPDFISSLPPYLIGIWIEFVGV